MAGGRKSGDGARTPRDSELEAVRRRVEHWRRTREKRTRMPEELWSAAVSLTESRGVYRVARGLRVNYETLTSRVLRAEAEMGSASVAAASFVELAASPGPVHCGGSVVELRRGEEARLTIRLCAGEALDVVGLASAFLGSGR